MKTIYLKKLSKVLHDIDILKSYLSKFEKPLTILTSSIVNKILPTSNLSTVNEIIENYVSFNYAGSIPNKIKHNTMNIVMNKKRKYCKDFLNKILPKGFEEEFGSTFFGIRGDIINSHYIVVKNIMDNFIKENFNKRYLLKNISKKDRNLLGSAIKWFHNIEISLYINKDYFIIIETQKFKKYNTIQYFIFSRNRMFLKEIVKFSNSSSDLFFTQQHNIPRLVGSSVNFNNLKSLNIGYSIFDDLAGIIDWSHSSDLNNFKFDMVIENNESIKLPFHNKIETIVDSVIEQYKNEKEFMNSNILINGHGGTGKTFYLNNVFINKYWKDLCIVKIKNEFKDDIPLYYGSIKPHDEEPHEKPYEKQSPEDIVIDEDNENRDAIDSLLELYDIFQKPICVIWEEFENIIHNHSREQKMKMILDRINLENLPIFFIFSTNNYKKLNDSTIYRTGRINYIEEIDEFSYIKINRLEKEYKELLHDFIEMKENVSLDSECFISDYSLLRNVFKKLIKIKNKKKQRKFLELVNITTKIDNKEQRVLNR